MCWSPGSRSFVSTTIGAQTHFIVGLHTSKDPREDLDAILEGEITGTPAAVAFNPEIDFSEEDSFCSGTQPIGTSQWAVAGVQAGNVALICWFPDISDGMPHAYHGMYNVVEVGE